MVTVTIKNIPEQIYERIKAQARSNHRSINGEILSILEQAISLPPIDVKATLQRAWQGTGINRKLYSNRRRSRKDDQ